MCSAAKRKIEDFFDDINYPKKITEFIGTAVDHIFFRQYMDTFNCLNALEQESEERIKYYHFDFQMNKSV